MVHSSRGEFRGGSRGGSRGDKGVSRVSPGMAQGWG